MYSGEVFAAECPEHYQYSNKRDSLQLPDGGEILGLYHPGFRKKGINRYRANTERPRKKKSKIDIEMLMRKLVSDISFRPFRILRTENIKRTITKPIKIAASHGFVP